ncbi:uncharacterized protein LOC143618657 [Bidens hawaiensis]|uniref:uncharacterized protein LOC143618657 n=1 Tax=Bidens hawaiensis TaxID=980011 RepID=UPI004049054F
MLHADSQSSAPVTSSDQKIILQDDNIEDHDIPDSTVVEVPPDFPPESFWLSKDAEFDWFYQNAFLERKESTRGNVGSMNLNNPNSGSQRYSVSVKPKTPIIGLPKTQKTTYVDLKCRQCKPLNVRLFPKQLYSFGKAPVTEPASPKVSCMGRVRSKRCCSRKNTSSAVEPEKSTSQRSHKPGLMSFVLSLFRCDGNRGRNKSKSSTERSGSGRVCVSVKPVNSEPGTPSEPVGLGGMTRFASGRR